MVLGDLQWLPDLQNFADYFQVLQQSSTILSIWPRHSVEAYTNIAF